jgi:copper ion binding protein
MKVRLFVEGNVTPSSCALLSDAISRIPGVNEIDISGETHVCKFAIEGNNQSKVDEVVSAIRSLGHNATPLTDCSLRVEGMTCQSCVKSISSMLAQAAGVVSYDVSLAHHAADVIFSPGRITKEEIKDVIENAGFDVFYVELEGTLSIQGMTCQSCVRSIEGRIGAMEGVKSIQVSLADANARLVWDSRVFTLEQLREAVDDMGFEASIPGQQGLRSILQLRSSLPGKL